MRDFLWELHCGREMGGKISNEIIELTAGKDARDNTEQFTPLMEEVDEKNGNSPMTVVEDGEPVRDNLDNSELGNECVGDRATSRRAKTCPKTPSEVPNLSEDPCEVPTLPEATSEVPNLPEATSEVPNLPEATCEVPNLPEATSKVPNLPEATSYVPNLPEDPI
ncbi:uncharacterized protein [Procambarus clarkii]|uniref:uncharacterized protein n=1 Tax=Procambarus clarkii TaxID=6728 RepID=UPI003744480F